MQKLFASLRIVLGTILLWAFVDKLLGFGFDTEVDKAWLVGGSPTTGFLKFGTSGPFVETFQALAGQAWVDWLFMLGLLLIGATLILGITMKISGYSGSLLMTLLWLASVPPEHHPFFDEHVVYILVLLVLVRTNAGDWIGFGKKWRKTSIVKQFPILS